jgi:hypothetical protein
VELERDVITSMTAFLSRIYFCTNCYKGYNTKEENTLATTYAIIDVGVLPPWCVIPTPTLLGYDDFVE